MHISLRQIPAFTWRRPTLLTETTIGWGSLIITVLSSSTYNGFAKNISSALSPLSLLFVSQTLIAVIVLFSFGVLPSVKKLTHIPRRTWPILIAVGVTSGVLAPFLWFTGLQTTTAINSALFGRMEMIFMLFLAFIFLKEQWTRGHVIGGIIIVIGILCIMLHGGSIGMKLHSGDLLIILSCFVYAVGSMLFRMYLHGIPAEIVILWRSITSIAAFFLLAPFLPETFGQEIHAFPLFLIPALLGYCFIAQFVNIFTFYQAMDRLPVSTVSFFISFEIIGAMLFAHLYLHEPLHWYHIAGGFLILLGTITLEFLGTHPSDQHLEEHLAQERGNA